jgi:hypothetical protein
MIYIYIVDIFIRVIFFKFCLVRYIMSGVPVLFLIDIWKLFTQKELKRLVAYARSSANLLTKLILHDQIDFYKWEVSLKYFSRFIGLGLLDYVFVYMSCYSRIFDFCSAFPELL